MQRFKVWWGYLQKETFFLGFAVGAIVVGVCATVFYSQWLIKYQSIAGAVLALTVGAWTISLTILHREEDKFQIDAKALSEFGRWLWNYPDWGENFSKIDRFLYSLRHTPNELNRFVFHVGLNCNTRLFPKGERALQIQAMQSEILEWIDECEKAKRYLPFNPKLDPHAIYVERCEAMLKTDLTNAK